MRGFCFFFLLFSFCVANGLAQHTPLPDTKTRLKIIDALGAEMARLDGQALAIRRNRPIPWDQNVGGLLADAVMATDWTQYLNVFAKLDASYPNLHASMAVGPAYSAYLPKEVDFKIEFSYDEYNNSSGRFLISRIDSDLKFPAGETPILYEELLAINGRPIESWREENFEFCKFSLLQQCNQVLYHNLRKGILSWKPGQPLLFKVRHLGKTIDVTVETKNLLVPAKNPAQHYCENEKDRYGKTMKLIYTGNRACVYQEEYDLQRAVLRITSFDYSNIKKDEKLNSVEAEVAALYPWWEKNAYWNQLFIDVIDNAGGAEPTEYLKILLRNDFQQTFIQYKKIKELDDPVIRQSVFWDSKAQELWFQKLVSSGQWNNLVDGELTPSVPMFCPDANTDCSVGLFTPYPHFFYGRINILLNQWCLSACDDFVNTLHEHTNNNTRFFGQPNAGDSAYSRLAIHVYLDSKAADGFRLEVTPTYATPAKDVLLTQTVVISQYVDSLGKILSGMPMAVEVYILRDAANTESWPKVVLDMAKYY